MGVTRLLPIPVSLPKPQVCALGQAGGLGLKLLVPPLHPTFWSATLDTLRRNWRTLPN